MRTHAIRHHLLRIAAPLGFVMAGLATSANAFEPGNTECIAPAGAGGGWDFTCRQVGKTLQDLKLIPGSMQVTNLAGAGGGVAKAGRAQFQRVAGGYADFDDLRVVAAPPRGLVNRSGITLLFPVYFFRYENSTNCQVFVPQ